MNSVSCRGYLEAVMRNLIAKILLCGGLSACAAGDSFTYGGQSFPEPEPALALMEEDYGNTVANVRRTSVQFPGKAIVFLPNASEIEQRGLTQPAHLYSRRVVDYVVRSVRRGLETGAEAIRVRGLFSRVEIRDSVGLTQPMVSPGEHGIWYRMPNARDGDWKYLNAEMAEPAAVSMNRTLPSGPERINEWLDTLTNVIERNGGRTIGSPSSARPGSSEQSPASNSRKRGGVIRTIN